MEKPKAVNSIIFLWILTFIFLLLHCWHYLASNFAKHFFTHPFYYFCASNIFLVTIIVIIFSILEIKKWSWLVNIIFSFHFLLFYGVLFFHSFFMVVFYSTNNFFNDLDYIIWTFANIMIPVIMFIIILLLFRPSVKNYLNNQSLEE